MSDKNSLSPELKISLTQSDLLDRVQYLELNGDDKLRIVRKTRRHQYDYSISLKGISTESTRHVHRPWKWLGLALALLALSALYTWSTQFFSGVFANYWWSGLLLGISASALCLGVFLVKMEHKQVYLSPFARVPVLELLLNKPNRKTYQQFIAAFNAAVSSAQETRLGKDKRLAGELKMLRRLRDQGVLESSHYDKAKAIIFKLSDTKPMDSIDY